MRSNHQRRPKIIRIVTDFFLLFFSISSLHGLPHLADVKRRHPVEILIWAALVIVAIYGTVRISSVTLTRYQDNPTVISMERDQFAWNTSFPGATVCPLFKLDKDQLEEYVKNSVEQNKTLLKAFLVYLSEANYSSFEQVVEYHGIPPEKYMDTLRELKFKFNPTVSNSGLEKHKYGITETVTEMGICYSFNAHLAIYNSPEYWKRGKWDLLKENDTFYVNPLDGEIFTNLMNMETGFQVS